LALEDIGIVVVAFVFAVAALVQAVTFPLEMEVLQ
jgi:hypothetical protein